MIPEPAFWVLFGAGATVIFQRLFRYLKACEREATPSEFERAQQQLRQGRAS